MHALEDQKERNPPNQVVGVQGIAELKGDFFEDQVIEQESQGPEYFSQKPDRYDRPMLEGVVAGPPIPQAVYAYDHAGTLPNGGMLQGSHSRPLEKTMGPDNHPGSPNYIINGCQSEAGRHPIGIIFFHANKDNPSVKKFENMPNLFSFGESDERITSPHSVKLDSN
jgi:hypothetical protein